MPVRLLLYSSCFGILIRARPASRTKRQGDANREVETVKLIAIEEHFLTAEIRAAWASSAIGQEGTAGFDRGEMEQRLDDLGPGRIALMDESGVDVQVLSVTTPALHNLEPEESVALAQLTNDRIAAAVASHPTRFEGSLRCRPPRRKRPR